MKKKKRLRILRAKDVKSGGEFMGGAICALD
jgi:hypothetical protein